MDVYGWEFIEDPPDRTSSESDWEALTETGYLDPSEVLESDEQIQEIQWAVELLQSFFDACREAGIREEM